MIKYKLIYYQWDSLFFFVKQQKYLLKQFWLLSFFDFSGSNNFSSADIILSWSLLYTKSLFDNESLVYEFIIYT